MADTLDLNLDALRAVSAEAQSAEFTFQLDGYRFTLVPALPLDVLGPLIPQIPAVIELLKPVLNAPTVPGAAAEDIDLSIAIDTLLASPMLPINVIVAFLDSGKRLFGADQWERLVQARPTLPEVRALVPALWKHYGLSLGELSRSAASSARAGQTSKATSNAGSESTAATSGGKPTTSASKASAG